MLATLEQIEALARAAWLAADALSSASGDPSDAETADRLFDRYLAAEKAAIEEWRRNPVFDWDRAAAVVVDSPLMEETADA